MDTNSLSILTVILWNLMGCQKVTGQDESSSKSMLGFCDHEYYIPKYKDSCDGGIYFGHRPPKCVCIKGIYRMYLSNCEVADGFAEEICTSLQDTETETKVKGVKLTKELNFDDVAVVYDNLNSKDSGDWAFLKEGERGKLSGKTFYTVTGQAVITNKGKSQTICVQRDESKQNGGRICHYRHTDNVNIWPITDRGQKNLEILVRTSCDAQENWTDLKPFKCFEPLTLLDSDCQLPCDKTNVIGRGQTILNPNGIADLNKNCTDQRAFVRYENLFLDRRLIHYLLMKSLKHELIEYPQPTRSETSWVYELFDQTKRIAMASCSFKYLPASFQNNAADLFMYLLRGNHLNYDIFISEPNYIWIKSILEKCEANLTVIPIEPDPKRNEEEIQEYCEDPKATGYCRGDPVNCKHVSITLSSKYSDYETKHYVPEVVWLFLDIVHINCFRQFTESYRMFHMLEQVIEKMFIVPIKDLWHNPTWTHNRKMSIMGAGVETSMWNMEICAESVYHYWDNILHRLKRPNPFNYHSRKKRTAEHLSPNFDVYCAKKKQDFKLPTGCTQTNQKFQIIRPTVVFMGK